MKSDDEIIETLPSLPGPPAQNAADIARIAMEGGRSKKSSRSFVYAGALACAVLALLVIVPRLFASIDAVPEPGAQIRGSVEKSLPQVVIYAGESATALVETPWPKLQQQVSAEVVFSTKKSADENNFAVYLRDKNTLVTLQACMPIPEQPQSIKLSKAFRLESNESQLVVALFQEACAEDLVRNAFASEVTKPSARLRVHSFAKAAR